MNDEITMAKLEEIVAGLKPQQSDGYFHLSTDLTPRQATEAQAYLDWVLAEKP